MPFPRFQVCISLTSAPRRSKRRDKIPIPKSGVVVIWYRFCPLHTRSPSLRYATFVACAMSGNPRDDESTRKTHLPPWRHRHPHSFELSWLFIWLYRKIHRAIVIIFAPWHSMHDPMKYLLNVRMYFGLLIASSLLFLASRDVLRVFVRETCIIAPRHWPQAKINAPGS